MDTVKIKKILLSILMSFNYISFAHSSEVCTYWLPLFRPLCYHLQTIWQQGDNEIYGSGYAWHNRFTYSREKIEAYNEAAWGGGIGKGLFERNNWYGLYAIAFLDSHKKVEPVIGYSYLKIASIDHALKAGIGYTVLITSRADINHNLPFPGALPWASIIFNKLTLAATYIPGFNHNGNVLYLIGKYTF